MSETPHELSQLQRWMQAVMMHPGGIVEGMQADDARTHIDVQPSAIESVICPSREQSSVERLEIYAHAYYARLLECLRAEFPMTARAIGEDLFDEFAIDYLQSCPSQSYTLDQLGGRFAGFLAETRPDAADDAAAWLGFLPDLAALEWHFAEVFDGPGAERLELLDPQHLAAIGPERWADVRLTCVPCLRIAEFAFPVHEYYLALRRGEEPLPPARRATRLAITRRDYIVRHRPLAEQEAAILASLLAGQSIGDAIAAVMPELESELPAFAAQLQTSFHTWSAEGYFLRAAVS
ncbi:MAG TPA: DNA-binding domain-containing protein [Pirellulales bacterium]|nr:DNA-binding domain-containing protein [Pirellulales bacterium]